MDKFWRLLYFYCLGGFIAGVVYLTAMLFLAPRQDALKRGFIPCTEKLVIDIYSCERGKISCPLKYLWKDMKCNVKVILNGFGAWIKGSQPTPWANYLFEPKVQAEIDEDAPYSGNAIQDMDTLKKQIYNTKTEQDKLEKANDKQLNINKGITISNPEDDIPTFDKKAADKRSKISDENIGDISDEVFEDAQWNNTNSKTKEDIKDEK